jgi:REP element-mobilizing transposase RayT
MNSAKRINLLLDSPGVPAWQRNYYECIIRDGTELHAMRKYIRNNPALWDNDEEKRQAS